MYRKYYKIWTEKEIKLLIKYYSNECITWPFLFSLFPDRRQASIKNKADELDLKRLPRKKRFKSITSISGNENDFRWMLMQRFNECGKMIGIGYFDIIDNEEKRNKKRKTELMTVSENGKPIHLKNLNKRDYTNQCELCGETAKRLVYHHWNKSEPSLGMWICQKCHWLVEFFDKKTETDLMDCYREYNVLKIKIEKERKNVKAI